MGFVDILRRTCPACAKRGLRCVKPAVPIKANPPPPPTPDLESEWYDYYRCPQCGHRCKGRGSEYFAVEDEEWTREVKPSLPKAQVRSD